MPLYEYECDTCAHRFEKIQKFSDPLVDVCPKCAGHVRKLLSSPAIQFKGSGFYITDYPRQGKTGGSGESSSSSSSSSKSESAEKSAEKKSDTKSDSSEKSSKSSDSSESKPAATPAKGDG
jgi:putative FmdB family regulatory protein